MKKIFLHFTAITLLITSLFTACNNTNSHNNKTEKAPKPIVGLNAQPEEEVAPAPSIDSSADLKDIYNPIVQGMNAQPQLEIEQGSAGNTKK
ncbi:MAG: hypothetical protein J6581_03975 [Apibacter sp.]|nr:hypothetical protein [Apibacter sp.]